MSGASRAAWALVAVALLGAAGCIGGGSGDPAARAACENAGGTCTGVGACGDGVGFIGGRATSPCGNASMLCCIPTCGGATENFVCNQGSFSTRPVCVNGALTCETGTRVDADAGDAARD